MKKQNPHHQYEQHPMMMMEGDGMDVSQCLSETCSDGDGLLPPAGEHITPKRQRRRFKKRTAHVILASLGLVAALLCLVTYFLLRSSERTEFETAFKIFARETAVIAEMHAENVFGQLQSLASALRSGMPKKTRKPTSSSSSSSSTLQGLEEEQHHLHEISIDDFDMRSEEVANLTGIELLMFVPFVPEDQRRSWEDFQLLHQEWILTGYEQRGWDTSHLKTIPREIYDYALPEGYKETRRGYVDQDGFMEDILANNTVCNVTRNGKCSVPVAQIGPRLVDTSVVMMDLFSHPVFKKEIIASLEYGVPVISEVEDLEFLLKHLQPTNSSWAPGKGAEQQPADLRDYSLPRSFTLDQVKAGVGEDSVTVGFVVGVVQWNAFFRNFLHSTPNINGIMVNISSDCGRYFNYVVNGGRQHEWYSNPEEAAAAAAQEADNNKYQYLEQQYKFFWKDHPKGTSRHCHFDLLITPSEEFAQEYITNGPLIWAAIVLAMFVGLMTVFFLYDYLNEQAQRKIRLQKAKAEAVVTSLFPKQVAASLMEEQNVIDQSTSARYRVTQEQRDKEWQLKRQEATRAKPMAELYPSASIYFADIKGFTSWSSQRQPAEVFELLETIYHEFDAIAQKRGVFKIETIGDCYVAACGIPEPSERHAVILARFAQNCLDKFREVVAMLDETLGPGTAELELRTGLHSGAVTAGVLRGDRARYQIFGDTVNTASRVESTGEGGKIQTSTEFANELIKFGKGNWITPRKEKVEAKGKGKLQNFWLQVTNTAPSTVADPVSVSECHDTPGTFALDDASSSIEDISGAFESEAFQVSRPATRLSVPAVASVVESSADMRVIPDPRKSGWNQEMARAVDSFAKKQLKDTTRASWNVGAPQTETFEDEVLNEVYI